MKSSIQVDVQDVIDDRLKQADPVAKAYYGSGISFEKVQCIGGSPNNSKNSFGVNLVPANFLDRRPLLHAVWSQTFNVTATADVTVNSAILTPGVDIAMSSYPFQRLLGVCSAKVNGKLVSSFDLGKYIDELLRISDVENNIKKGTCPSALSMGFAKGLDGYLTNSQVNGTYNEASANFIPNGAWTFNGFSGICVGGGTATLNVDGSCRIFTATFATGETMQVTVTMETYEPLLLPPFLINQKDEEALFGLSNIQIDLPVDVSKIQRILSSPNVTGTAPMLVAGTTLGWASMALGNITTCELLYQTFPVPNSKNYKIPMYHSIHSYDINPSYITQSFVAGAKSGVIISQVKTMGCMPHRILLFAKRSAVPAMGWNNYYYQSSNVKINLSGFQQNMLASATSYDLYRISCQAGLKQDYLSWSGEAYALSFAADGTASANQSMKPLVGGPIVLIPGVSFPLPEGVTTGSEGSFTFDFTADITNITGDGNTAGNFDFHVLYLYDLFVQINTQTLDCVVQRADLKIGQTEHMSKAIAPVSEEAEPVGGILAHMTRGGHKKGMSASEKPTKLASRVKRA